jgi:hypothetical protein
MDYILSSYLNFILHQMLIVLSALLHIPDLSHAELCLFTFGNCEVFVLYSFIVLFQVYQFSLTISCLSFFVF